MRRAIFLAAIAALFMVRVGKADIILTFSTGDAGTDGGINVISGTQLGGSSITIDTLTVTGDGLYDGVYDVIGNANGNLESNVGNLSFNTDPSSQFITIVGGVVCTAINAACSSIGQVLVADGTTLLQGTGAFTGLALAGTIGNNGVFTLDFDAPDSKDPGLLSALGIIGNQWKLHASFIATGTGNAFPVLNSTVANTQVPEPTSLLLFGTSVLLFSITHVIRQRTRRA